MASEVAPGLVRLGSRFVNWYLLDDGGRLTVFDAGFPGYYGQLERELAARGRRPEEVEAVVLTHAHTDHTGFAERLRRAGVPVYVHEGDRELATTFKQPKREASWLSYLGHAAMWRFLAHTIASGGARPQKIAEPTTFRDGDELDVAGRPRVVHAPGHTDGCCALHLADRGAVVAGDVVYMLNPATGETGPQPPPRPFNRSTQQALDSLARVEALAAEVVVVGHGEPWRGTPRELVERVRARAT
jgi:glyoxylase-like metal-dependent hydrolase (beta-lactamase superfamily II)